MSKTFFHPSVSPATLAELRQVADTLNIAATTSAFAYLSVKSQEGKEPMEITLSPETVACLTSLLTRSTANVHDEITTQQAADLLGVSRPYFVKLLDAGKMPFRRVGHYRRVRRADIERFVQEDQTRREAGLNELAALTQEIGLEY